MRYKLSYLVNLSLLGLALLNLTACNQLYMLQTGTPSAVIEISEPRVTPTVSGPIETVSQATPVVQADLPTPIASPDVYTVVDIALDDVLNVRAAPGVDSPVVGSIQPYGMGLQIIGPQQYVDGEEWAPVRYGRLEGWANRAYLAQQIGETDEAVAIRALKAIQALKVRDLEALAGLIHPEKGVRFSPYAFVDSEDMLFLKEQIAGLWADQTVYRWGNYDGSGMPIELTFEGYYLEFIYDVGFARPHTVGFNTTVGHGNTINNVSEAYPGATVVEYYFPGFDPKYEGLDWRSLRLVFELGNGTWFLVGLVHDEWTI